MFSFLFVKLFIDSVVKCISKLSPLFTKKNACEADERCTVPLIKAYISYVLTFIRLNEVIPLLTINGKVSIAKLGNGASQFLFILPESLSDIELTT